MLIRSFHGSCFHESYIFYVFFHDYSGIFLHKQQEDLSSREEVYNLMGYSLFSSKAMIFFYKCQFCHSSRKVAWMNKNSDRCGNDLKSKFRGGFLGGTIFLVFKVLWPLQKSWALTKILVCAQLRSLASSAYVYKSYFLFLFSSHYSWFFIFRAAIMSFRPTSSATPPHSSP